MILKNNLTIPIKTIMKRTKTSVFRNITLLSIVATTIISCNKTKMEDSKDLAIEHNEGKYNNTDQEKDAAFLVDVAEINLEEIELGKLAQTNSMNSDVKKLGKMMETDHDKAFMSLKELAAKKNITIPTSITEKGEKACDKLKDKTGAEFDKAYCDMMVDGHKDAITKFEKASTDAKDEDIRLWAKNMTGTLRTHLDHALNCQQYSNKM